MYSSFTTNDGPNNEGAGIYKYKVANYYNNGCNNNCRCKQDIKQNE